MNERDSIALAPFAVTKSEIVLGTFSASHLGDVLCASPLPRLLVQHRGLTVYVKSNANTNAVFTHNPFVAGLTTGATTLLDTVLTGNGHILQRLLQGFELPMEAIPRPELYLDAGERAWAAGERLKWPANRPVCILSCGAVTDNANLRDIDWVTVCAVMSRRYTVIQPVVSEPEIPGCEVYRGLSTRQYMSLFAVADCFLGGTSGGSHIAAAFNVPAIIVVWRLLQERLRFPVPAGQTDGSELDWKAAYIYPQHWFVSAEELEFDRVNEVALERILAEVAQCGSEGRPNSIGNHGRNPSGFIPRPGVRVERVGGQRLVRVPAQYGSREER